VFLYGVAVGEAPPGPKPIAPRRRTS
jgi:hypothetical protein